MKQRTAWNRIFSLLCVFVLLFISLPVNAQEDTLISGEAQDDPAVIEDASVKQEEQQNGAEGENAVFGVMYLQNQKKQTEFYFETTGTYAHVSVTGTYKKKEPSVRALSIPEADGKAVLEAWTVDGMNGNMELSMAVVIAAMPALEWNERISVYSVRNDRLGDILLADASAQDKADLKLSHNQDTGIALVKESTGEGLVPGNAIWANDDLYITGKIPGNAVVSAVPVKVDIDGRQALTAYEISIYANASQMEKGKTWKPADEKVQVHFHNPEFENAKGPLTVYHLRDEKAAAEKVAEVKADENGWIAFDADSFSIYAVAGVIERDIRVDGETWHIAVSYDSDSGIPSEGVELLVKEIKEDDDAYDGYLSVSAERLGIKKESIGVSRAFDLKIVDAKDHDRIYEPKTEVDVEITLVGVDLDEYANVGVLHFVEGRRTKSLTAVDLENQASGNTVRFSTDSFSVYIVAGYTIETFVEASDGNTYRIAVEYDENAGIPMEGTALRVEEILPETDEYNYYFNESIRAIGTDADHIGLSRAFDIKIVDAGDSDVVYEPKNEVRVSITLVGEALKDYADVQVLHFDDDSSVSRMEPSVSEDTVEFTTDRFSVYSVSGTVHVRTFYFYTFDEYLDYVPYYLNTDIGSEDHQTHMQIVREGETPVAPQNPVNPQDQEATFSGWYLGSANTADGPTATVPYSFGAVPDLTEDDSVYLYAKFSRYIYVIFHDQHDAASNSFPVAFTRRLDLGSEQESDWYVDVTQYSVSYEDPNDVDNTAMVFVGWSDAPISTPGASLNDDGDTVTSVNTSNGKLYTTETIHLYPIFAPVKWVSFYSGPSGSHATYFADTCYLNGEGPERLSGSDVMTRDGNWQFAGWYVNAHTDAHDETVIDGEDCVKVANADGSLNTGASEGDRQKLADAGITFENTAGEGEPESYRIKLTENVTIYAYWTARTTANYTVVIVKQNASDEEDGDVSNNTYYYSESFTLSGTIGDTLDAADSMFASYRTLNSLAGYNALHDPDLTDNETENPYAKYTLSPNSDASVTVAENGSGILYFRYDWTEKPSVSDSDKFTLRFVDPMAEPEHVIAQYAEETFDNNGTPETMDNRLAYNTPLNDKVPATPISTVSAAGLTFNGWYADRACTTRAFFEDNEDYQNYNGARALFENMPAADMTFYAGWTREWFLIKIDPNYGELYKHVYTDDTQTAYEMVQDPETHELVPEFTGTGATWMWKEYGDTFQEYTTIRRDYVESDSGSWYYVKHDRAYHGYPDTWVSGESGERKTYYTKQPSEATELGTFDYEPGVYRYAGWYEVLFDENGNEIGEADSRYDFSRIVDHNITLRLRWQKVGAFYLQYDPGVGTLKHDEENEVLYLELDGDSYADDADVLITRTATAPTGYEFVGWRIRSDESETVYRAGQTFHLLSKFMATVQGKRTVFLDAVYEQVPTATIVYYANGGSVESSATEQNINYGGYPSGSDFSDSTLVKTAKLTDTEATATVAHIVNNSEFVLSDGAWLSMTNATFAGWCENRVFDPEDTDHPLLTGDENYRIGANEGETPAERIVPLYAIWQVDVAYHLNEENADFGGTWDSYTLSGDTYTSSAYIGSTLSWPPHDPVYTGSGSKSFLGWATRSGEEGFYTYTTYDFSQPVTGALDLYAVWGTAPTCDVVVVDTSNYPAIDFAPWVDGNNDGTNGDASITLTSEHQAPADLIAAVTAEANTYNHNHQTTYAFSFATVASTKDNIQEERIDQIYFSPQDGKTHLVYNPGTADERDVALDDGEQLCFVYYQVRTPGIGYLLMENSGNVTDITSSMDSGAPRSTADLQGVTIGADTAFTISSIYQPMGWLPATVTNELGQNIDTATDISYYSFAIGAPGATNSVDLAHKTQAYTDADTRPDLYIKNTWQGLLFSQDGATWFSAGTDPKLYVIFYTEMPTIVTLYNRTVGLAADRETQFTYDYWIEEIPLVNDVPDYAHATLVFTTRDPSTEFPQNLCDGDTFSVFTTTKESYVYRVTFVLTTKDGFTPTLPTLPTVDGCNQPDTTLPTWIGDTTKTGYYSTAADVGNAFSYTVREGDGYWGKTAVVPFTNTREYAYVDLHIAKAELDGKIYHTHEWRKDPTADPAVWNENNVYTVKIPLDGTVNLFDNHTYDKITQNVSTNYVPGALIYGRDTHTGALHQQQSSSNDVITLDESAPLSCFRLAYEKVDPNDPSSTVYNLYMKDERNDYRYPLTNMADQFARDINGVTHPNTDPSQGITQFYRLYYLFYPAVTVYYVIENSDGTLELIKGDSSGQITYDGAPVTLNGYDGMQATLNTTEVKQGQKVGIWERYLEVCQDVGRDQNGNPYFNVPPLLDRWDETNEMTHKLDLIYYMLGASTQNEPIVPHNNISDFPGNKTNGYLNGSGQIYSSGVTETLRLTIGIEDHKLQWKFEDEPDYLVLDNWPVIYAIYRERGYNLTVTKTVTADTGYTEPYTVTITSMSINRDQYTVSGTGYSTIEATPDVPAANGNEAVPGVITFDVRDGDSVTILGLIPGEYTVVETGNENDTLTAKTVVDSTVTDEDVENNSTVSFDLSGNTELQLTNAPKEICRIGTLKFHTLTSAVAYIADHSTDMTGTIEMLTDYLMPASDTPVIPSYLNVTLTTANDYNNGNGGTATITRKSNVTTPMINNLGTFTLGDVILDGNHVSGSAMISNEGTLTLGGSISVTNLTTTTTVDPVTQVETTTTTATPATVTSTSPVLKNAAGSGDGGAIYGYKGAINMKGGTIESCSAENGGGIYAAAGTVNISGGEFKGNHATNGGAIYYAGSETVTISGGSIGAQDSPNTATNGAGIYMGSGTVDITGGSISYNEAAGSGGGIYAHNAYVNVNGANAAMAHNTAVENGGAVCMETLTFKLMQGSITGNSARNNGGAIWSGTGSVEVSGGSMSENEAVAGSGGAVYANESAFNMTGGKLMNNTAKQDGGAVYAEIGSVNYKGGNNNIIISGNTATNGSGGGIYAGSGAVTMTNTARLVGNKAENGYGGALYVGSGAATLTGVQIGKPASGEGTSSDGNKAINGSGVFVDTGSVTIDGGNVKNNVASEGGAVGVGNAEARLYFKNNFIIKDNTMTSSGSEPVASNVYLNYDTDAIINFQSIGTGSNTYIGIYVSDDPVTVEGESTTVLEQRGVPSTRFGVYVSTDIPSRLAKIHNDRTPNLTVANDKNNKKLYWVRNFTVKVYYVADYSQGLPFGNKDYTGSFGSTNRKKQINDYNPPAYQMAASEIATDLRDNNSNMVGDSAVFGHAFLQQSSVAEMNYADYLKEINWNTQTNVWDFVKQDDTNVTTNTQNNTLIFIYTEPYYLSIENNAKDNNQDLTLVISDLTVTVNGTEQSVIGNYGYVFAKNDEIQNELMPVTANDLVLKTGESIRILLPGGKNMAYSLTGQYYSTYNADDPTSNVPYNGSVDYQQRLDSNPTAATSGSVIDSRNFTVTGNTPSTSGQTHELIFGGDRAVCRVVVGAQILDSNNNPITTGFVSEHAGEGATAGKYEYTFSSPKQAYQFIETHSADFTSNGKVMAKIEMLLDYMMSKSDKVSLTTGGSNGPARDITFQTAVDGYFRYDSANTQADGMGTNPRATISRGAGNTLSFIEATTGTLKNGDYGDKLTVNNLIFDGKSFGGKNIEHGIIDTFKWNVEVDRCDFNNCQAKYGGGMFIKSVTPNTGTPYGHLTVTNSNFNNCQSLENTDKYGGGGIWTSMKTLTVEGCSFTSCYCAQQGGAVFHFVDTTTDTESYTTINNCSFEGCSAAKAAGSVESGAREVHISNTTFRNSTSNEKNGGALNIWSGNSDNKTPQQGNPTTDSWVYLTGCTFENCYALNGTGTNGNGGAMRSTAKYNTITDCTFINNIGNNGGAINIYNQNAVDTVVSGCTFDGCSARDQGGAIWCRSKTLTIDSVDHNTAAFVPTSNNTSIRNCTASNAGGGICHLNTNTGSCLTVEKATIDTCSSTGNAGGGVYTTARAASFTDSTVQNCYTVAANMNGGGLYLAGYQTTLSGTTIRNCTATGLGGGVYQYNGTKDYFTVTNHSVISGNIAQGSTTVTSNGITYQVSGGGIYTNTKTFTLEDSSVLDNQAAGNGGGVCQNYDNATNGMMTLNGATVTGNISGGKGGGLFTLTNMTLLGNTAVTGNRLRTEQEMDAAGVYLRDGVTLTLGQAGGDQTQHVFDITGNLTVDGKPSNLRLPDTTTGEIVNDNKVKVYCGIGGEIRVVNAKKKLTRFGTAQGDLTNPAGFTDEYKVFWADDGSLYGIVDRTDTTGKKIIWGGDPICKITDGNGRLLYIKVDDTHYRPAVFDRLDSGNVNDTSTTSAFSTLRGSGPLYYINGEEYTGTDYQVKMLVENYTAEYYITALGGTGRNVTLTTAKTSDSMHPYRGREGTRCTILRDPRMDTGYALITAKTNLNLTNIVLDGGSENGVTAKANTRVITADAGSNTPIQITLGRNATLQNAACTGTGNNSSGNGGGVYLNNGARLAITGGTIRNCNATNGGAVYIDDGAGTFTMSVGTITKCTAEQDGGGVYFKKGKLTDDGSAGFMRISGSSSITRCTAKNGSGGGVYLNGGNGTRTLYMSGGSIASNSANAQGGGIFVGDANVRIYFSGTPYVNGNTSNASVAPGKACNLEMNQTFNRSSPNPETVIVSSGLNRGATIGVYVPGEDSGKPAGVNGASDTDTLYDKHGAEMDPFATFTDGNTRGLNYFLNDRNGMKGGQLDNPNGNDYKIYWRIIYALSVKKQVLSDDPNDMITYRFRLTLTGEINNQQTTITPDMIDGVYGDLTFTQGIATFTLNNGQTKSADLLPLGFGYKIEEILNETEREHFYTSVENWNGTVTSGTIVEGAMNEQSHFNYMVSFSNIHAICKVTDEQGRLLYTKSETGKYVPAVYSELVTAFNKVNVGNENHWLYLGDDGEYYDAYPASYQIQMLVPECETEDAASLMNGRIALLTTADKDAEDGFPYVGARDSAAKITRAGFTDKSMITVSNGSLTLGNIILDGNGTAHPTSANGGILNVASGSSLTVGTGATLQNSKTSGNGAAICLAEGAAMNISGGPVFANNVKTGANLGQNPANGTDASVYPDGNVKQDIYIAGYPGVDAGSLAVTGDITSGPGSIWVWAQDNPHFIQNQQFAVMENGPHIGLDAFRNARPDSQTQNPLKNQEGTPLYLYGVARDGKVFWSGSMNLTISKTLTGGFAIDTDTFSFTVSTVSGLDNGYQCDYVRYTYDGSAWTADTGNNASGKLTADADGKLSGPALTLGHNQKIVISIPRGITVTVRETNCGYYTPSYVVTPAGSSPGERTYSHTASDVVMNVDTVVDFTNNLDPAAPTGYHSDILPFLLLLLAGLLLAALTGRRRKKEH